VAGLNETKVKNHTHADGEFLWDGDLSGFGLRVKPSGSKSFLIQYRPKGMTVTRRFTLGKWPVLKVEAARVKAMAELAAIANGANPSKDRKDAIALRSDTLADAIELYLATTQRGKLRKAADVEKLFAKYVTPLLGKRPRREITRADVKDVLAKVVEGATRGPGYVMANHVLKRLHELFAWMVREEHVERDPTEGITPHAEQARDRVLDDRELRLVWQASEQLTYPTKHLVQLLLLTGQRRTEVGEIKLSELDLDQRLWTLPRDRSKTATVHEVPLSDAAWAVVQDAIAERTKLAGNQPWTYLLVTRADVPIGDYSDIKEATDKAIASLVQKGQPPVPHWTFHDLRRSLRTRLGQLGVQPHISEMVIGHQKGGVVAIYDRYTYRPEKLDALTRWADMLARLASGKSNVLQWKTTPKSA
jgi:integrase